MDAESSPAWCASLASLPDDLLCALVPEGRVLLMARTCKRFQLVLEKGRCDVDLRVRPQVCYDARLADVMTAGVNNLQLNFKIRRFECSVGLRAVQIRFCAFEELSFMHLRVLRMHSNRLAELHLLALLHMFRLSSDLRVFEFTEQSLKSRHVQPLADCVRCLPRLEVLSLHNNFFVFDALGVVLDAVQTSSLTTLVLSSNSCEDADKTLKLCRVLQLSCGSLTSLSLSGMRLRTTAFDALVDALGACGRLRALDLSYNHLHYGCLMQVLTATAECPLRSFDWSGNRLGSAGTFVLASHIQHSRVWQTGLQTLKLRLCDVYHGLQHLAEALTSCACLRALDLSSNSVYAHEVVNLLASTSLTSLNISHNNISDYGMQLLLQRAMQVPALQELQVVGNHMSRHTFKQFKRLRGRTCTHIHTPDSACVCNACRLV
jgi:Ran GTPase-activating protein (RanGAP) involved in mRNA processing and transport